MAVDFAGFEDPRQTQAADRLDAYLEDVCGITVSPFTVAVGGDLSDLGDVDVERLTDGTGRDVIVDGLLQAGFSESEASCLADAIVEELLAGRMEDPNPSPEVFDSCGIDAARLAEVGS